MYGFIYCTGYNPVPYITLLGSRTLSRSFYSCQTMALAKWNESAVITILKEADLKKYKELCLRKGLNKEKHLRDVHASLLQRELGMESIMSAFWLRRSFISFSLYLFVVHLYVENYKISYTILPNFFMGEGITIIFFGLDTSPL